MNTNKIQDTKTLILFYNQNKKKQVEYSETIRCSPFCSLCLLFHTDLRRIILFLQTVIIPQQNKFIAIFDGTTQSENLALKSTYFVTKETEMTLQKDADSVKNLLGQYYFKSVFDADRKRTI